MKNYIWMPHPQHFIGASSCQFRLGTYVNGYIISTVGEYRPSSSNGEDQEIGADRKYETMVFKASKRKGKEEQCCPYQIDVSDEVDFEGYNDAVSATQGHYKFCKKYEAE